VGVVVIEKVVSSRAHATRLVKALDLSPREKVTARDFPNLFVK
jgi:hypothetical protein